MDEKEKLLTVSEMAEFLRVPRSWIYARTRQKDPNSIPRVQCGKYIRFHVTEVLKWLKSNQDKVEAMKKRRINDQTY